MNGDRIAIVVHAFDGSPRRSDTWLYVTDTDGVLRTPPTIVSSFSHVVRLGDGFAVVPFDFLRDAPEFALQRYDLDGQPVGEAVPMDVVSSARPHPAADGSALLLLGDREGDRALARVRIGASGEVLVERTGLVISDSRWAALAVGEDRALGARGGSFHEVRLESDGSMRERALSVPSSVRATRAIARWDDTSGGWIVLGTDLIDGVHSSQPIILLDDGERTTAVLPWSRHGDFHFDMGWPSGDVVVAAGRGAALWTEGSSVPFAWGRVDREGVTDVRSLEPGSWQVRLDVVGGDRVVAVYAAHRELIMRCDLNLEP